MNALLTLWKFSRPHTIIGSVISILTLYYIVCEKQETQSISYLVMALSIGVTCNLFIVGINQIADVNIDKINKPYLPIPSKVLSMQQAKYIVITALLISLGLALYISPYLFGIITLAATIGWAYSMPPFYLKQHHVTAAIAITAVRGVLLNAGGFLVFNYLVNNSLEMPENVIILTLFIIVFSIVISWFKDLPDVEGDAQYNIKSFAILYSPRFVLITGNLLVAMAYIFTIAVKYAELFLSNVQNFETKVLFYGHILLLILFVYNAVTIKLSQHSSIKKFYKRFWWFFFAEYALYLLAYATNA
ncbi:MAG: homogentisate phytyltransferase [Saprospiraceae bacterium]|nr:homogentisate phytyltransferase [Candidatus Vicinibacter affinis]MBK6824154.1 homogentisate phytyltransferase [Candidatus Vicinibacter affinis]MBK7303160.1 homogentisate phytyltransferase [Candidatus Vicinibacter affinis]MBK7799230.1 homogentisate phytyltransferase [Candidatus Vicinibacter affinis]MBK8403444.1 homogentisate phytyltransferase [Candidatus Vicinibacter affinis]